MNPGSSRGQQANDDAGGCSVLIVEDLADSRKMLAMLLTMEGHRVQTAADGTSGLAMLIAEPPDVALIDIGLPGIDGYELARRARKNPQVHSVRLVALTGRDGPEDRAAAKEAGFDNHLVKPVSLTELTRVLRPREHRS